MKANEGGQEDEWEESYNQVKSQKRGKEWQGRQSVKNNVALAFIEVKVSNAYKKHLIRV